MTQLLPTMPSLELDSPTNTGPTDVLLSSSYVLTLPAAGSSATIPAISAYQLGTGDFTLQAWFSTAQGGPLVSFVAGATTLLSLQIAADGDIAVVENGTTVLHVAQTTSAIDSTWHQVSLTRTSGTLALYLDGVLQATGAEPSALALTGVTSLLFGASTQSGSATMLGKYADIRLFNVALTQAQVQAQMFYRLPSPTTAIGYWTFTNQTLSDSSPNRNNGGTMNGAGTYVFMPIQFQPQIGTLTLVGSASSVTIAGNAAYNVGTGDFSIETWANLASSGTIVARSAGGIGVTFACSTQGLLTATTSDGATTTTVTQSMFDLDALVGWHHLALVRMSSVLTIYIDGVPVGTATEASPTNVNVAASVGLILGHPVANVPPVAPATPAPGAAAGPPPPNANESSFSLQVGEVRFWNVARPQSAVYACMLTQLHGTETGLVGYWPLWTGNVIDVSPTRNLSVAANDATVAPSLLPLALPQFVLNLPGGQGSYAWIPSQSVFNLGTADFTFELRFKATAAGTLLNRPIDPTQPSVGVQIRATAQALELIVTSGAQSTTYSGTAALLDGAWHHVAFTRTNGTIGLFVDLAPVACTPAQSTQNITSTTPLVLGAAYDVASQTASDELVGSIDFVYLWNSARPLPALQKSSFQMLGSEVTQTIGAWSFDQQAPIDQSPTGANGSLGSAATIVADSSIAVTVPSSIAHVTGAGAAIDCSARTDLSFGGLQAYTVAAWVMPMSANATGTIVSRYDVSGATGAAEYRLRIVNGVAVAQRAASNGSVTGITLMQPGKWYYVSMSYDGTNLSVAVNGITEASAAVGAITPATATHVYLAASANASTTADNLECCVQNASFWSTALDTAALQAAMAMTLTGTETNLIASYDFIYAMTLDWTGRGPAASLIAARYQSTTLQPASLHGALAFGGNGSYLDCGGGRSLNVKGGFSIEAWIRPNSFTSAWQPIVSKGSVYALRRYNETNQITFSTAGVSPASAQELPSSTATNLLDGNWHHVVGVYDGTTKYLYVDGVLNTSIAASGDVSVGNGVLYVADNDGEVLVLDQETGNEIWTARTFKPIQTSPVVDKNVMCVSSPTGNIFAFDYANRQRLWATQIPQGYQVPMTISRDVIYFSGAGTAISAIDLLAGTPLWNMNGLANQVAPVIVDDLAYYGSGQTLYSRDIISGRVKWGYSLSDEIVGAPVIRWPLAYVATADSTIYALDLSGIAVRQVGSLSLTAAPIDGPVDQDGTLFIATSDGTITSCAFNATTQQFTTIWSAQIAAKAATQPIAVDVPYAAIVGSDNNLYAYNTATGALVWQYQYAVGGVTQVLSGLTVMNGAAYVSSADGNYLALDLENKAVLWTRDIQTVAVAPAAVTYSPFCIGATVNEQGTVIGGTFNGLITEVRLWARPLSASEVTATWHRRLVGDEAALAGYWACGGIRGTQESDLSPHMNPAAYVGTVQSTLIDLEIQQPLPRILAQSQMMQNWTQADVTSGNKDGQITFRTEITLLDGNGNPLTGSRIRVWTDAPTTLTSGGVAYATDNQTAADLTTDARGMISVVSPCSELTSSTLQIWTEFMAQGERVIIHPDDNLRATLGSVSGTDLIDPSQSTNPLLQGKQPLLTGVTTDQANGLATAINNAVQNVKRPDTTPSMYGYRLERRGMPAAGVAAGPPAAGDVVSQQIALTGSSQYAQYMGAGQIPNWKFTFTNYQFQPLSQQELHQEKLMLSSKRVMTAEVEGFWDLWDDFVNGVKEAANVIINIVATGVEIIVQWVDTTIQTLQHVFESVAQVGQAIFGVFMQVLDGVVDAAKKIYQYFAFLFNWDDILATKNAIVGYVRQGVTQLGGYVDTFIAQQQQFFASVEQSIDDTFEGLIARLGKQNLGQFRDMAPQMNPLTPGSPQLSNPQVSGMRLQAAAQAQGTFGTEGNWLFSTALDNANGITGGGDVDYNAATFDLVDQAFTQIAAWATGSKAVAAFAQAFAYFKQILSNPESFVQLFIQGLLEALKGIAELAVEIASAVCTLLLQAMKGLILLVVDILSAPIDIPIVSWLYTEISGSELSMLDFIALLTAIPTTIVYKAIAGTAPFQAQEARFVPEATGSLTPTQKALKTTAAIAQLLNVPLTMVMDLQPVMDGPTNLITNVRMQNLANAINVKRIGNRLGPNLFRWASVTLQLVSYTTSAPWYFSSSPNALDVGTWIFAFAEFLVVQCTIAIFATITAEVWPNAFAIYASVAIGGLRLVVNGALVLASLAGPASSPSAYVSAFFSPLPQVFKFLRTSSVVTSTEGLSLPALAIIDFVCGVIPPSVSLGLTWS